MTLAVTRRRGQAAAEAGTAIALPSMAALAAACRLDPKVRAISRHGARRCPQLPPFLAQRTAQVQSHHQPAADIACPQTNSTRATASGSRQQQFELSPREKEHEQKPSPIVEHNHPHRGTTCPSLPCRSIWDALTSDSIAVHRSAMLPVLVRSLLSRLTCPRKYVASASAPRLHWRPPPPSVAACRANARSQRRFLPAPPGRSSRLSLQLSPPRSYPQGRTCRP